MLEDYPLYKNVEFRRRPLLEVAKVIVEKLRENGYTTEDQPHRQALALAGECGEFVEAYRRYTGQARRTDTLEHVIEELADVIITAYVTAAEKGWDLDSAIQRKLAILFTRGWREGNDSNPQETVDV